MNRNIIIKSVVLAWIVCVVGAQPVLAAYLDPNTGGLMFQLLAVIFAFFSAMLLFFSARIKMAFSRGRRFVRNLFGAQQGKSGRTPANPASSEDESYTRKTAPDESG